MSLDGPKTTIFHPLGVSDSTLRTYALEAPDTANVVCFFQCPGRLFILEM